MSQPEARRLSVIMPVYNEEGRHVLDHVPGSELVVIDDGSRDATGRQDHSFMQGVELIDHVLTGTPEHTYYGDMSGGHVGTIQHSK